MMNLIGKGLVLIYTVISMAGLCLALLILFEFVDWGRSEPRISRGVPVKSGSGDDTRIASEYDKSKVIFDRAVAGRDLVLSPLTPAEDTLHEAEVRFAQNHLYYVSVLKPLRTGPGDIEVKGLPPEGIPTDTPGKVIGKPIADVKIEGLDKSLATYTEMLKEEQKKLDPLAEAVRDLAEKNSKITFQLTGKDEVGKKQHGILDLIDLEFGMKQRLLEEREYWQPKWASVIAEARRFSDRRLTLEGTLTGLEQALKERQAKQK